MAFFDKALEIGKKVGETTASVAKSAALAAKEKSEQAIEIGKLRKDILIETGRIAKLHEEVGKNAYEVYCATQDYTALEPQLAQIQAAKAKIADWSKKIEEIKAASSDEDDGDSCEADGDEDDCECGCNGDNNDNDDGECCDADSDCECECDEDAESCDAHAQGEGKDAD